MQCGSPQIRGIRGHFVSVSRIATLSFCTFICFAVGLFILVLPDVKKRRANMILVQFWSRLCCLLFGIRVRSEGEPLPHQLGYLVVANHMSYFDIIVLASVMPGIFISKSQVRYWPLVGLGATLVGTLFFDRKSKEARQTLKDQATERLRLGQNIFIFPEGTTSDGRKLLPFRYGAFDIAIKANKPVLPVAINYADPETIMWTPDVSFLRHILRIGRKEYLNVRLHIGPVMGPQTFKSSVDFSEAAWQKINSLLIHFGMRTAAQLASINWQDYRLSKQPKSLEVRKFMTRVLSLLLQVDSSTPPGERQVCQILASILEVNNHTPEFILSPAGHTNLLVSKGHPTADTLDVRKSYTVLLGNSDVVPTDSEGWQHPPFSGAVEDDVVWGRGAIHMKGLLTVFLTAFLTAPAKTPLKLLCVANEEQGGKEGAHFIASNHFERLAAKVILGEGGFGISNLLGSEQPIFLINSAEKGSLWLKLSTSLKTSAHSSVPPRDYPLAIMAQAVQRITKLESDVMLLPITEKFLTTIGQASPFVSRMVKQAIQIPLIGQQMRRPFEKIPYIRAMFRNTVAATKISGPDAKNVLAQQVEATLDCRLLPGVSVEGMVGRLHRLINDNRVEIEITHHSSANETPFTDDHFRRLRQAVEDECKGAVTTPFLLPAHTGLGYFREKGVPCFGFFPGLFRQEALDLIHGPNERVKTDQMELAYRIVLNFINRSNS